MPIRRAPFDDGTQITWNVGGREHVLLRTDIPGPDGSKRALNFIRDAIYNTLQSKRDITTLALDDLEKVRTTVDDTPTQFLSKEGPTTFVIHRHVQVTVFWAGGRYSTMMERLS